VHGPHGTRERLTAIGGGGRTAFDDVYEFETVRRGKSEIGPFEVTLAPAAHPVETYSIRLTADDRTVAYSGDSGPTSALAENALGADLFLCEATWEHGASYPPNLHMTASQAGDHAQRAQARQLWLVHTTPFTNAETLKEQAASKYDGELDIPAAGATYTV
jgi:ribonuclease BN (tRNA processing enzyme)